MPFSFRFRSGFVERCRYFHLLWVWTWYTRS